MSKRFRSPKNASTVAEREPVESPDSGLEESHAPERSEAVAEADPAEVMHLAEATSLLPEPTEPAASAEPAEEPDQAPEESASPVTAEAQHIPAGDNEPVLEAPEAVDNCAPMPPKPTEHVDEPGVDPEPALRPQFTAVAGATPLLPEPDEPSGETQPHASAEGEGPSAAQTTVEAAPRAAGTSAGIPATSFAAKTFSALAVLGPIAALLFLLAQTLPGFGLRPLWIPGIDEAVNAGFGALKQAADPLVFGTLDRVYPSLPPAYFWFLAGLEKLWLLTPVPMDTPMLLLGGTLVSSALLVVLTWIMARVCCGNRQEAFAATAVLLGTLVFFLFSRVATPDALFAACVLLSCLFLYIGYIKTSAPFSLLLGFLLAGLAVFIDGLLGLILPLGASFLFLMWRGTFRRGGAKDGAFAFFVLLAALGGFLAWLGLTYGAAPLDALMRLALEQWSLTLVQSPELLLTCGLGTLALLLPWTLLLLFLPWERLYRLPVAVWRTRNDAPGVGFVWCAVLVCLLCIPFSATPIPLLVVFMPFVSILAGRAIMRLSPTRSRLFFGLFGVLLFVCAIAVGVGALLPVVGPWLPFDFASLSGMGADLVEVAALPGMIFVGAGALLFAFVLLKCTDKRHPGGGLLVTLLCATVLIIPVNLLSLPVLHVTGKNAATTPAAPAPAETPAAPAPAETPAVTDTPATPAQQDAPAAEQAAPKTAEQAPVEAPATPAPTEAPAEQAPAEPQVQPQAPAEPQAPGEPQAPPAETPVPDNHA